MKKFIYTTTLILIGFALNAQIKVYSTGNSCIGSTSYSPKAILDVYSSSALGSTRISGDSLTHYYSTDANPRWGIGRDYLATGQAAIAFGAGSSTALDVYVGRDGSGNLLFQTNSSSSHNTRMIVTSAGSVQITQTDTAGGALAGPPTTELFFQDNGQIRSHDNDHRIIFFRGNGGTSYNIMELREYGDIIFSPGSSGNRTQKIVFKSSGNVGIGTTSPSSVFSVGGSGNSAWLSYFNNTSTVASATGL